MFTSALCFGGGFVISAFGVWWHQLWIIYLGYGVLGGCGLGLGYISPVSALVKWFPNRPGMATGMAIMGFGGGAFIGSNLSLLLMDHFKSARSEGVGESFLAMGLIYFGFMVFGSIIARVAADDWKPAGYEPLTHSQTLITTENVSVDKAWRTVRRRVLHYSGLLERSVWIDASRRNSRPSADCMVGCRYSWSSSG